jgi:hypothetical protein
MKLPPLKPPPGSSHDGAPLVAPPAPKPRTVTEGTPGPISVRKMPLAAAVAVLPASHAGPLPSEDGTLSARAKLSLADIALQLRDEQLQAKIIHYRADLATNSELDAITAQVVRELTELQRAAKGQRDNAPVLAMQDRDTIEVELITALRDMLSRFFRDDRLSVVFERKLTEVSKRFARLFFRSELHEKIAGTNSEMKSMRFPEQGLYHMFMRNEDHLMNALESLPFATPAVCDEAVTLFANIVKDLRDTYLSRTTPELNELVTILHDALRDFLVLEFPPSAGELAAEVIRDAKLADSAQVAGYKISAESFLGFRTSFERHFMQRLVSYVADTLLEKVNTREAKFRSETLNFVADPRIFSEVCEVICDTVYDLLYNDGFLDLPNDWRAKMTVEG